MANKQKPDAPQSMTKVEAVRRALDHLGPIATGGRIQDYVRDNFGLEMSADHVYTTKAEILRRAKEHKNAKPRKGEVAKQAAAEPRAQAAAPGEGSGEGGITRIEAVRRAVTALGKDAPRTEIQTYVKDHYGIDMTVDRISTVKAEVIRKARQKKKKHARAARATAVSKPAGHAETKPAPAAAPPRGNTKSTVLLADVLKLRDLLERIGPDHLRTLIDVMGK
jgi:hypothetical protein